MQQALREINNDISRLLQENQALINHMTEVRESERHYLATELHDVFGQHLAAMDANLTVAKHLASGNNENFQQVLDSVISSTTHLRELTRNKLRQLKPPSLNSIGLSGAVRELVSDWQQTYDDIEIEMDIELDDQQPCEAVSLAIYRALQEGLVNIARHAEASMAEIRLWSSQENASAMVNLTLKDNGRGLPEQQQSPGSGLGLVGIRERSHALGGRFEIGNRKPRGAQLTITLPFNSSN
jgi:glucose-6-phosphate-specific signal transduction histidine kinase